MKKYVEVLLYREPVGEEPSEAKCESLYYAQELRKISSSSSVEMPWMVEKDMKHNLYFSRAKSQSRSCSLK